jgi:hypothetical protein
LQALSFQGWVRVANFQAGLAEVITHLMSAMYSSVSYIFVAREAPLASKNKHGSSRLFLCKYRVSKIIYLALRTSSIFNTALHELTFCEQNQDGTAVPS